MVGICLAKALPNISYLSEFRAQAAEGFIEGLLMVIVSLGCGIEFGSNINHNVTLVQKRLVAGSQNC